MMGWKGVFAIIFIGAVIAAGLETYLDKLEASIRRDEAVKVEDEGKIALLERISVLEDAMLLETCGSRKDWITDDLNNRLVACLDGPVVNLLQQRGGGYARQ